MLFASAGFLFAFLPIFMLVFAVVPDRAKKTVVLIGSVAFYVVANLRSPFAIAVLWLAVLFHYFAAHLLRRHHDRPLLALFIAVDIMALVSLRLLCNQMMEQYYFTFPIGASLYLLMGISYLVDSYREPSLGSDDLFLTALYLTFFPIMVAGPLIRFRDFSSHMTQFRFRADRFARGARVLTVGLVKVLGVSAMLVEAYESILQFEELQVNMGIGILSLAMMYLIVFFSFSGYSDMGVGLCIMLGLPVQRDYNNPLTAISPMSYLKCFFCSFYTFMETYLIAPLESAPTRLPLSLRRAVGRALYVLLLTLWFRIDTRAFAIALPLIAVALLELIPAVEAFCRHRFGRLVGWLATLLITVVYWAQFRWENYAAFFAYLGALAEVSDAYQTLYTYATTIGFDFILIAVIAGLMLMPISFSGEVWERRAPLGLRVALDAITSLILLVLLLLTFVYFMPQFPQYAVEPFAYFVI